MALTDKLTDIADAIRGKTGKTDKLSLDQMPLEIAGIVSGGGGGLAYDMGEFVLDADVINLKTAVGIPHQLGETPDFVLVWTDDFADLSAENVNPYGHNVNVGYIWLNGLTGAAQRITTTANNELAIFIAMFLANGAHAVTANSVGSVAYGMTADNLPSAEKIALTYNASNTQKWKAGVTYKYFVSKAWWNVGGVANA